MNPYLYKNFKNDMRVAVSDFVNNTNYKISYLNDSYIQLSNKYYEINFYLDGMTLISTIKRIGGIEKSIYEILIEKGLEGKYPFDKKNKFSYKEYNQYKVSTILSIINTDLKEYVEM